MGLGYRPELKRAIRERTREIVSDPTSDWRRPQVLTEAT
jgi:hypothetical protein